MALLLDQIANFFYFSIPFYATFAKLLAILFITIFFSSIGSFLNVCIYRIPLGLSIIKPGSYCPKCQTPIKAWHNIPIISYFLLRGKCHYCHKSFSFRYCFVELITALLAVLYFIKNAYIIDLQFLKFTFFMSFGIMIFFIDIDHKLILDKHNYTLLVGGLIFAIMGTMSLMSAILGSVVGFSIFYSIAFLYLISQKKAGLGGGDIKYIAAAGMFTGVPGVIFIILFSSVFALLCNFINIKRNKELAFAPYLVAASLLYFFLGDSLINWYLGLINNLI